MNIDLKKKVAQSTKDLALNLAWRAGVELKRVYYKKVGLNRSVICCEFESRVDGTIIEVDGSPRGISKKDYINGIEALFQNEREQENKRQNKRLGRPDVPPPPPVKPYG